ncbi:MAG: hypothetical protein JWM73_302, partial [Solirubrobacterales bacterium]|nr:hypothetical protein [Solirubrobacterales bacterium]
GAALLDIGEPIKDVPGKGARYVPAPGTTARAVLTAQDPVTNERWGVATYHAAGGQQCIVAGQLRGQTLGLVSNGTFRPYTPQTSGPCGDLRHGKPTSDARYFPPPADRTVIYGLIRARTVQFRVRGRWFPAHVGHGGAYMLLFQGRLAGADVDIRVP